MKTQTLARIRKSRKPALLHLAISALIAMLSVVVVVGIWYPGELSSAQGVSRVILIMIGVDVVLGPLITLIVYDRDKPLLWLDLIVIAATQTTALLYGLTTIYEGRPAYVVFNVDRFDVVALQDVDAISLSRTRAEFKPSFWKPLVVAARMPTDSKTRSDLLFSSLSGGADLPQLPEYFVDVNEERANMLAKKHSMAELRKLNELDDDEWQSLLDGFSREESELAYIPLLANARDGAVILDAKSGDILGIRLLTPRFGPPDGGSNEIEDETRST